MPRIPKDISLHVPTDDPDLLASLKETRLDEAVKQVMKSQVYKDSFWLTRPRTLRFNMSKVNLLTKEELSDLF